MVHVGRRLSGTGGRLLARPEEPAPFILSLHGAGGIRGEPRVFISHGTRDRLLPIDHTSREIVPRLERGGYDVQYREFDGGHTVPPVIASEVMSWFLAGS